MPETGQSWQKTFKALPIEAPHVRLWTLGRVTHPDAPAIANELFAAVLGSGADIIEMTISTAGPRTRITARGPAEIPLIYSHGPGWLIVSGLAQTSGLTTDSRGLWAQLGDTNG